MDAYQAATEIIGSSFILTILVSLWLALIVALAICNKVVAIHKCVRELREKKEQKLNLLTKQSTD